MHTGTYLLILHCSKKASVPIGRLGTLVTEPGYYIYVGSAFGPGGIPARLSHHEKVASTPHWHIDYLRHHCALDECWYTEDSVHYEHDWAERLQHFHGARIAMPHFGSSDCQCSTHLFHFHHKPRFIEIVREVTMAPTRRLHYRDSEVIPAR